MEYLKNGFLADIEETVYYTNTVPGQKWMKVNLETIRSKDGIPTRLMPVVCTGKMKL